MVQITKSPITRYYSYRTLCYSYPIRLHAHPQIILLDRRKALFVSPLRCSVLRYRHFKCNYSLSSSSLAYIVQGFEFFFFRVWKFTIRVNQIRATRYQSVPQGWIECILNALRRIYWTALVCILYTTASRHDRYWTDYFVYNFIICSVYSILALFVGLHFERARFQILKSEMFMLRITVDMDNWWLFVRALHSHEN
jgi:hypothetical protein